MSTLKHLNIAGAYNSNGGVWPKDLSSGVMFYRGQKVTKEDFRRYRRDGMEMKLRESKTNTGIAMNTLQIPEFLLEMSRQMRDQDNRCTAHPFFQVRCKRYIVTEEGYNEHHWELHAEDSEGIPTYSTEPHYDNKAASEDFEEDNKEWCREWMEENTDPEFVGEDDCFLDFFDFEYHKNSNEDWPDGYYVVHLQEIEETVSTHLTEADANWFIKRKQHDYPTLYTYAESAYWSPQIKLLQDWIKGLESE